jgi:hypothetical protein
MHLLRKKNRSLITSYLTMRKIIGLLGILLPISVVLGGFLFAHMELQESISSYYHSNMRDFLIGLLFVVALFLITYKGFEMIDDIITNLTGIFALGIVFFPPVNTIDPDMKVGIFLCDPNISSNMHDVFTLLFFVFLSINSLFLFTLSHKDKPKTPMKKVRNTIYIICGIVILVSVVCIIVYCVFLKHTFLYTYCPVLILETVALVSFGVSWLVKGEPLFLKDGKRAGKTTV